METDRDHEKKRLNLKTIVFLKKIRGTKFPAKDLTQWCGGRR